MLFWLRPDEGGSLVVSPESMDRDRRNSVVRRLFKLVYRDCRKATPTHTKKKGSLPGPFFDAAVVAAFVVTGLGYLLS
jgi:hypothetical protein